MVYESKYQEALDYFRQLIEFYEAFGSYLSPLSKEMTGMFCVSVSVHCLMICDQ